MPTTRPRHQVTETPDVERALDVAARRWPDETRSQLLLRLIQAGSDAVEAARSEAAQARVAAIEATRGSYADVFGDDYLAELREDWPK